MKNSVILTTHDKAWLTGSVVDKLVKHTREPFELIVVYDGCTDDSRARIEQVLASAPGRQGFNANVAYKAVVTPDVFEIRANNAGVEASSGEYVLLIQDDVIVDEDGWDVKLLEPLRKWPDVFLSSARQAYDLVSCNGADLRGTVGMIDDGSARGAFVNGDPKAFTIRDGVTRGPIALERARLLDLGGFDEAFAPQMWDDADLCYRAYAKHGWLAGVRHVETLSDTCWGTTRMKKGQGAAGGGVDATQAAKSTLIYDNAWAHNLGRVLNRHRELIEGPKHDETRHL